MGMPRWAAHQRTRTVLLSVKSSVGLRVPPRTACSAARQDCEASLRTGASGGWRQGVRGEEATLELLSKPESDMAH